MNFNTIITVAFSGAFLAFLQFLITFFITRKDNKEKEQKEDKKAEEKAARDERFTQLETKIKDGLAEREETGKARYEEHHRSIAEMSKENKENFDKLLEAIDQLKINDSKVVDALEKICSKQDIFGDSLLGLTHFELVYITDIIIARGKITVAEKATIESMYDPYKRLHGNGICKQRVSLVMTYPIISDEEAKKLDEEIAARKIMSHTK